MNVKYLVLALCCTLWTPNSFAETSPTVDTCRVIGSWVRGVSAVDICKNNHGSFCGTVKNRGQGLCYGANANFCGSVMNTGQGLCYSLGGSFCSSVQYVSQGICYGLSEPFCSSLGQNDNQEWVEKLIQACSLTPSRDWED